MHNLKIADIHGKDLSIGVFGYNGDAIADNAEINMTGEDGYNGLYANAASANQKVAVNSFAAITSQTGNVKLDNAEGKYNIHGDILADRFSFDKIAELKLKQYEDPEKINELKKEYRKIYPDWTEDQITELIDSQIKILENILNNTGRVNLGASLPFTAMFMLKVVVL